MYVLSVGSEEETLSVEKTSLWFHVECNTMCQATVEMGISPFLSWHTLFTTLCSFFGNYVDPQKCAWSFQPCGNRSWFHFGPQLLLKTPVDFMNHLLQPGVKHQVQWMRNTQPEDHKNAASCNYFLGCSHWERGINQELSPHVLSSKRTSERGNHCPNKCICESKG